MSIALNPDRTDWITSAPVLSFFHAVPYTIFGIVIGVPGIVGGVGGPLRGGWIFTGYGNTPRGETDTGAKRNVRLRMLDS